MALRAQSTGPSCKLNNVAPSTDMYRVSGQAQTSSPRTRFLYLRIFHPIPIPALSRRLSPSHRLDLILFTRGSWYGMPTCRRHWLATTLLALHTPVTRNRAGKLLRYSILRFLDRWIRIIGFIFIEKFYYIGFVSFSSFFF